MSTEDEIEITPEMVTAGIKAMDPYFWEDGSIGSYSMRSAVEAALRSAIQAKKPKPKLKDAK